MIVDVTRCPDPERLAAFLDGTLSGAELESTADHVRVCPDCRFVLGIAAPAIRDQEPAEAFAAAAVVASRKVRPRRTWLAAAAAALVCVVAAGWWVYAWQHRDPMGILAAAVPGNGRNLEPRLSGGFRWAPLRVTRDRGEQLDAGAMKLIGAAGVVLERTANDPSANGERARAAAYLLAGRPKEAAKLLERHVAKASDARLWNDLAATRYALALQDVDPGQFAAALAAADAALRSEPNLSEARFNRALILERLGLRAEAQTAWRQYLSLDSDSDWAREAQQHLSRLAPRTQFRDEMRHYQLLVNDPAAARALAERFPQDARVWGETEILGRWAEAQQRGDGGEAEGHLRLAREFGDALASRSGETMLRAAVASIERAGDTRRNLLADAHLRFRQAQRTYQQNRPAEAEQMFAAAAARFEEGGSPLAQLARYFAANAAFDQGRIEESQARLERLLATSPAAFPAYRAQIQWQLGLVYASGGRWGAAIQSLSESIAGFEGLGERKYATTVREILAEVYDRIGDPHTAWNHRLIALREIGQAESSRLQIAVDAIARAAALNRQWPVSASFLALELEMAHNSGDDVRFIETLLFRAGVEERMAQPDAARADLASATEMMPRVRDATVRERVEADGLAVAAFLSTNPADSAALLTRAIEYHRTRGRRMFLPELLLQRGRAMAKLGRGDAAAADFEQGIVELEQQRGSLDFGSARLGMFVSADELFEEALSLALEHGDDSLAFQYSERGRARLLLESVGESWPPAMPDAGTSDAVVIEYAALPAKLVIFVVDRGKIHTVQQTVSRTALKDAVALLVRSAAAGDDAQFRRGAAALYNHIVAPVSASLPAERTIVFVPDNNLDGIPFAALIDASGRYLVEQHAVIVAPSAGVFARLSARLAAPSTARRSDPRLLVIAGPPAIAGGSQTLSAADREARDVAAPYGSLAAVAPPDMDRDMDRSGFEARVSAAEIVHFVGHAVASANGRGAALVVSRLPGVAGSLDTHEIASLRLRQTRVVVLAACSSSRGEELAGEGTISVARGFLAAGVPSVVATLWPIEDGASADFFPRLHRHLAAGVAPAQALRRAQLEGIRQGEPLAMWAAVQLLGSG
jgi:CHAT domain-containing protein